MVVNRYKASKLAFVRTTHGQAGPQVDSEGEPMPRGKVIAIGCRCPGRKWHFEGRVLCKGHWHAAVDAHVAVVVAKRKMLGRMAA